MYSQSKRSNRMRTQLLTLSALTLIVAPAAASPQSLQRPQLQTMQQQQQESGAGTQFVACVDKALLDYNDCLMSTNSEWRKRLCDLAFQADVVWCGAVYKKRVETGT